MQMYDSDVGFKNKTFKKSVVLKYENESTSLLKRHVIK